MYQGHTFLYWFQGDDDLQTEADRIVQQIIIGNLSKNFPKIKIIGEEDQIQEASLDMITDTNIPEILELNCPQELADIKEEDVIDSKLNFTFNYFF